MIGRFVTNNNQDVRIQEPDNDQITRIINYYNSRIELPKLDFCSYFVLKCCLSR